MIAMIYAKEEYEHVTIAAKICLLKTTAMATMTVTTICFLLRLPANLFVIFFLSSAIFCILSLDFPVGFSNATFVGDGIRVNDMFFAGW